MPIAAVVAPAALRMQPPVQDPLADTRCLDELLVCLGPVCTAAVPQKVSRRARKRVARLLVGLIERLLGQIASSEALRSGEAHSTTRLVLHAYALLTWREPEEDDEKQDPARESKQWAALRRRLQLAEAGEWRQLAAELCAHYDAEASAR